MILISTQKCDSNRRSNKNSCPGLYIVPSHNNSVHLLVGECKTAEELLSGIHRLEANS